MPREDEDACRKLFTPELSALKWPHASGSYVAEYFSPHVTTRSSPCSRRREAFGGSASWATHHLRRHRQYFVAAVDHAAATPTKFPHSPQDAATARRKGLHVISLFRRRFRCAAAFSSRWTKTYEFELFQVADAVAIDYDETRKAPRRH